MNYSFIDLTGNTGSSATPKEIKTRYEGNPDTNAFTDALKSAVEQNKVKDVSSNTQNNTLIFTYMDDTTNVIDLTTLVPDIHVSGASLDATTNVLTLTSDDGGADVTVDLSNFVNSTELNNALDTKVNKADFERYFKFQNWKNIISGGGNITWINNKLSTSDKLIVIPTNVRNGYIIINLNNLNVPAWRIVYIDLTDEQLIKCSLTENYFTVENFNSYTEATSQNRFVLGYCNGDTNEFIFSNGLTVDNMNYNEGKITSKVSKVTSTDNAIARFDGTTGDIQDSGVIVDDSGNTEITGYTKLGSDAPAIKYKKLTGTTASTKGGNVAVAHGLDNSKIISVTGMIRYGSGADGSQVSINSARVDGYQSAIAVTSSDIILYNHTSDSENILSKPFTILITYEA